VGFSRGTVEIGQIVLVAVSGVAGAATHLAIWRLAGGRGAPLGAAAAVAVAVLSIALPALV
jgi:hypothetical protein